MTTHINPNQVLRDIGLIVGYDPKPPPEAPPRVPRRKRMQPVQAVQVMQPEQTPCAQFETQQLQLHLSNIKLLNAEQPDYVYYVSKDPIRKEVLRTDKDHRCQKNSVNCMFKFMKGKFVKIMTVAGQDPLINEVLNMKYLNKVHTGDTFLNYECHGLLEKGPSVRHDGLTFAQVLSTNQLASTSKALFDYLQTIDATDAPAATKLFAAVSNAINVIRSLKGVTHNDLHLGNVFYDTSSQGQVTIIDYGRMYVPREKLTTTLTVDSITEDFYALKQIYDLDYLYDKNPRLKMFRITDPTFGHMCDVATLCFNFVYDMPDAFRKANWSWPIWFQPFQTPTDGTGFKIPKDPLFKYIMARTRNRVNDDRNLLPIYDGLAFLALCCHVRANYVRFKDNNFVRTPLNHPFKETLSLRQVLTYVLNSNGTFRTSEFQDIAAAIQVVMQTHISAYTPHILFDDFLKIGIFAASGEQQGGAMTDPNLSVHGTEMLRPSSTNSGKKPRNARGYSEKTYTLSDFLSTNKDNIEFLQRSPKDRGTIPFPLLVDDKGPVVDIHALINEAIDQAAETQQHRLDSDFVTENPHLVKELEKLLTTFSAKAQSQADGGAPRTYKVYTESPGKRKYIRKNKQRWYLHLNRGKYRYTSAAHTHCTLSQKSSTNR
jgi:hypothetical protein